MAGIALAAAVSLWLGVEQLRLSARYGDMTAAAESLRHGEGLSPAALEVAHWKAMTLVTSGDCRADLLRAGLQLILADLDRQNSYSGYDAWAAAMADADAYIVHGISCTPTDGNLWARLAMVRWAIGENPQEMHWLLQQSIDYAPAEFGVLTARFIVWRKASAATLVTARDAAEADLLTLLTYATPPQVAKMLAGSSDAFRDYIRDALRLVQTDRVNTFIEAGLDPKLNPSASAPK